MRIVCLLAVLIVCSGGANAQEVTEEYVVNQLGPAAEMMVAAGIDGNNLDQAPDIIQIMQGNGIAPAFMISVDEARWAIRDRDRLDGHTRFGQAEIDRYPARLTLAGFMPVQQHALTCGETATKAQKLFDLVEALTQINWLNIVAGAFPTRYVPPLAMASAVAGQAASVTASLARRYQNTACVTGGESGWRMPDHLSASHSPDRSRVPPARELDARPLENRPWRPALAGPLRF
jgi:hypothetical protein